MKVKELIEQLSKQDPDLKVKFSYYFEGDDQLNPQWIDGDIADVEVVENFLDKCVILRDFY
jgi:hypothetical protein